MIAIIYGTRPELIKLFPIIIALKKSKIPHSVINTGQHRELVEDIIKRLKIKNDFDLKIFKKKQSLNLSISKILFKLSQLFLSLKPDLIIVQGDTLSTYASTIAAFNSKIKIAHVEAGLRTGNFNSPFPEEMYRTIVSRLADFHFCPTKLNLNNLKKEGINQNIFITGNTVVDAVHLISKSLNKVRLKNFFMKKYNLNFNKKIILFTCHRRENYGSVYINICKAIKDLSKNKNLQIVYPLHLNPNFYKLAQDNLSKIDNIFLIPHQNYHELLFLIKTSSLIITDSGGIQEEAPSFNKKMLVIRNTTERPEALKKNVIELVGTNANKIVSRAINFLNNQKSIKYINPYGDGKSAKRIIKALESYL